jgi:hypothetical protein
MFFAAAAWFCSGREATAQVGDPFYDAQEKIIREFLRWKGPKEERQRKIVGLMDAFGKNPDVDSDVIAVFGCVLRDDPHAIDAVAPRFAPLLQKLNDERDLGGCLEMLIKAADLPPVIVSEADLVFRRKSSGPYVKPRAAAIVLKAHPERADLLHSFYGQLASSNETERLNAAYEIGWAGKSAAPESKALVGLLKDSTLKYGYSNKIEPWCVVHSIDALRKIGARSATITAALERLSHDDDPEIASAANAAIEKLK